MEEQPGLEFESIRVDAILLPQIPEHPFGTVSWNVVWFHNRSADGLVSCVILGLVRSEELVGHGHAHAHHLHLIGLKFAKGGELIG